MALFANFPHEPAWAPTWPQPLGGGAAMLNAGDQDNLLICGTTMYDTEAGS
jgi:hypothetical protein